VWKRKGRDSVLNVSQLLALDRSFLTEKPSRLSDKNLAQNEDGMRLVLGL